MNTRTTMIMLALALSAPVAYSQASETPAPSPQPQKAEQQQAAAPQAATGDAQTKPLQNDPLMHFGKLDNGLSYIIRPTTEPKGRASLRLYVDTGSLNESPETKGISHFLEHMVFNGSRHFKRGELIPAMQQLGLGFGGDANAYTGLLQTVFMFDLPNLKDETVDFAFTALRDFADGAELSQEAIDHERGIVISELKSRDSEAYRASKSFIAQLCNGTRVPDYMPIGLEEVIRNCPADTIRQYYRDNYVPERMTVVVTGDFEPAAAEAWVKKYFSSMEKKANPPRPAIGTPVDLGPGEKIIPNPESAKSSIMLTVVNPWEARPDTIEQRIKDLPLQLACNMLNLRFSELAKKSDSPFEAAGVSEDELFRSARIFGLSIQAEPEKWQQALSAAEAELRRACTYGFSEQELKMISSALLISARSVRDGWETVTCDSIAGEIIDALSDLSAFTAPDEDIRSIEAGLAAIMADPDICRRALADAYKTDRVKLTLMGTIAPGVDEKALRSAYSEASAVEVSAPEQQSIKPFAYDHIGEPGKIVAQQQLADLGTTTLTLSNGVRVNIKPLATRKGSIQVTAAVDGGQMNLPAVPGLSQMLSAVMSAGGLEAHSADELQRILAGHRVGLSFGMSQDRFTFSGSCNLEELELQCKLLAAAIMHPGFRPEGEMLLRRQFDAIYNKMETTADGAFLFRITRILFGDDPRFNFPTREQFEGVNTDKVREVITPFLQKGAIEVTLVGDFKTEDILPVLERTFGAMPERNKEFTQLTDAQRSVSFRPWGQREFIRYNTDMDKTIVTQIYPAGDGMDRKRNRRLAILVSIAREKVFDGIRAVLNESYSPSVSLETSSDFRNAAFIMVTSEGIKGNRVKVNTAMDLIMQDLGKGNISQEDFDRAIKPYLARTEKAFTQPSFWMTNLLSLQSDPEQLELLRGLRDDVRSIRLEEVQQLAREVFGAGRSAHIFTVPDDYDEKTDEGQGNAVKSTAEKSEAAGEASAKSEAPAAPAEQSAKAAGQEATPAAAAMKVDVRALSVADAQKYSPYTVIITKETAAKPAWRSVADTLANKYGQKGKVIVVDQLNEDSLAAALRNTKARYAALVARATEINRGVVSNMHRAARRVDDDPYGDCLWGIVTGYSSKDAMRIARDKKPLVVNRVLGSTNVSHERFDRSFCLTDWGPNSPVLEQSGNVKPTETVYDNSTAKGREVSRDGLVNLFADELENGKPQLVVSSSHATQVNLEMPYSKGLIFPAKNRYYCATLPVMQEVVRQGIAPAISQGKVGGLVKAARELKCREIKPDGQTRVWLASGNCLFGDAMGTRNSMAVTALSAYTCNQVIGYTVPSWYGKGGWGTLSMYFDNTAGTTLAEAWFLNNQFILKEAQDINPKLLDVRFNDAQIGGRLQQDIMRAGIPLTNENAQDCMGLVHDRDVVAFYGDPAWSATLNEGHRSSNYSVEWKDAKTFTITANHDRKGRCAIWFPTAETGRGASGCDAPGAFFTNDFILFPELDMKKGETLTVTIK